MKLGEILLRERLITVAQLEEALELHRRFGQRVGSVLVELGHLDVDTLARALSGQHRVPAVLTKHVAAIDPKVVALFKPRLASALQAIPLGYTQTTPRRLVVALRDPVGTPVDEIAFAAGARVDVGVAPEILVRKCLERYYGVRDDRADLRLAIGGSIDDLDDSWPPTASPAAIAAAAAPVRLSSTRMPAVRPSLSLSVPPPPPSASRMDEAAAREQARIEQARAEQQRAERVRLERQRAREERLALEALEEARIEAERESSEDVVALQAVPISRQSAELSMDDADWDDLFEAPPARGAEGRPITAPPGAIRPVLDVAATVEALATSTSRDDVGETLTTWLQSEHGGGLVLIVKDGTALGWKGYAPDAEQDLIESIAMPLGPPSMLTDAFERRVAFCGTPPPEGTTLQTRLWKLLRCNTPSEVLVAPIVLGARVVNLLYAHTEEGFPASAAADATRVAQAAATAYARLIRTRR